VVPNMLLDRRPLLLANAFAYITGAKPVLPSTLPLCVRVRCVWCVC
jgi:hypothetical protein